MKKLLILLAMAVLVVSMPLAVMGSDDTGAEGEFTIGLIIFQDRDVFYLDM